MPFYGIIGLQDEDDRMAASESRIQLLASVATFYYDDGMTQMEIARRTGYSRSAVSRLLSEARDRGIVDIRINYPIQRATELEDALEQEFNLISSFVISAGNLDHARVLRLLGRVGARYLEDQLPEEGILGVSWGSALYEVANELRTRYAPAMQVVQMIGAVGHGDPTIDGPELAQSLAHTLGASYHTLHAPLLVEDISTRAPLMNERNVRQALALVREANMALVGIGSVEADLSSLVRAGYLSEHEMLAVKEEGAVGDICATHYDLNGKILDIKINKRVVGIELNDLRSAACQVVAVAGNNRKSPAILGALRGGFIDVLITDTSAAQAVLSSHRATGS